MNYSLQDYITGLLKEDLPERDKLFQVAGYVQAQTLSQLGYEEILAELERRGKLIDGTGGKVIATLGGVEAEANYPSYEYLKETMKGLEELLKQLPTEQLYELSKHFYPNCEDWGMILQSGFLLNELQSRGEPVQ